MLLVIVVLVETLNGKEVPVEYEVVVLPPSG
jgi:hypothetical protein